MMFKPLLSICIPTYNRKNTLAQTIYCLLSQCSRQDIEIIVSDNASEDGTAEYCMHQASSNKIFSYYRQEKNIGFSNNLIFVLSKASGKYLWMLGDDEVLHPEAVARILAAIQTTDPSWLICNFVKLDSPNDSWPVGGQISFDKDLHPLSLGEILDVVGIWSSFMSISVIKRDAYCAWLKSYKVTTSDYVGFEIALFSGREGNCFILRSPILARIKEPLSKHRFNKLAVYLFDFFDPIDSLVKKGLITTRTRISLAHEMFLSMAGFLLLKTKIEGGDLPSISDCIRYHAKVPMFWIMILPLLILPSWFVKSGISLLAWFVPQKSNSKLNRMIISLRS